MNREDAKNLTFIRSHVPLKERIELAIPACMLWLVCDSMLRSPAITTEKVDFISGIVPDLTEAAAEPFSGLPFALIGPAGRASAWAAIYALDVPDCGRMPTTLFIGAIQWLNQLLDTRYLELGEDTAFHRAATVLIDDINRASSGPRADVFAKAHKAGTKLARRIQERLEDRITGPGLFLGAWTSEEVAA